MASGADPRATTRFGATPLELAKRHQAGEWRAVASLLEGLLLELEVEEAVASGSACGHDVADGSR